MRTAAFALMACLAGCSLTNGGSGGECENDQQCGDDVCARSGECLSRSSVRAITIRWTVNGAPAASSCSGRPNLYLQFDGAEVGDQLKFAPVSCSSGLFRVDKLPKRYQQVELGFEGEAGDVLPIEAASVQVQFDLFQ